MELLNLPNILEAAGLLCSMSFFLPLIHDLAIASAPEHLILQENKLISQLKSQM